MIYLFAAFSVAWLGLFAYNYYLVRKVERLAREFETLDAYMAEREKHEER